MGQQDNGYRKPATRRKLEQERRVFLRPKRQRGVNWSKVDADILRCFLEQAISNDIGVGIYRASGGVGVMIRIYVDGGKEYEVLLSAEEMNEFLLDSIPRIASEAEDPLAMWGLDGTDRAAAD